jgi:zinc transporter ZupT
MQLKVMLGVNNAFTHFQSGYRGQPAGMRGNHNGHYRYCSLRKVGQEEICLLHELCGGRPSLRLLYSYYPQILWDEHFSAADVVGQIPGVIPVNRFLNAYVCHEYEYTNLTIGIIPMLGVGLHAFPVGVMYSVMFNVSIFTGIPAAIGMVLHEFPEGIVTFLVLERGSFKKNKSAWYAFLAAANSTPLGTLISYPFIERIERSTLSALLALSAGVLAYVGASNLLPAVERENKKYSLISMGAGIFVVLFIVSSKI